MKSRLLQTYNGDFNLLLNEVLKFRNRHTNHTQLCITSKLGDNNFYEGSGTCGRPEELINLNTYFKGTEIQRLVAYYPDYYRWRILCLRPRQTYSIHHDGWKHGYDNYRIHLPIKTNDDAFLVFHEKKLCGDGDQQIKHYNLKTTNVYIVNTTNFHTAVNYHPTEERIHIVAERFKHMSEGKNTGKWHGGKGSAIRKTSKLDRYADNYERIFGKKSEIDPYESDNPLERPYEPKDDDAET